MQEVFCFLKEMPYCMLQKPLLIFFSVICCKDFNTGLSTYQCWLLSAASQLPSPPPPPHPATVTTTRTRPAITTGTCKLRPRRLPCCNSLYHFLLCPLLFFCLPFLLQ